MFVLWRFELLGLVGSRREGIVLLMIDVLCGVVVWWNVVGDVGF